MDVAVVGCGYVGLVSGVCFASLGHEVLGIEIDETRLGMIQDGMAPFHEPGLDDRLRSCLSAGTFRVSSHIEEVGPADVVFLCVQTPLETNGTLDTGYLVGATKQIGAVIAGGGQPRVLVIRSTVVPGTTEELIAPLVRQDDRSVAVAVNPEFLREGSAVDDFLSSDRVVIGCAEPWGTDRVAELYADINPEIIRTSPATAEFAKCASNALLGTLISFSNQLARIAEAMPGVDVEEVLGILHRDRRLSPSVAGEAIRPEILSYLRSGVGFGGSCLPKDIRALASFAASVGEESSLLDAVLEINAGQPPRVVTMAREALGTLSDRKVAVLGLAFKADTVDLRESPGLKIVDLLLDEGAKVTAYDALVPPAALARYERRGMAITPDLRTAIIGADLCIITTRAQEFRDIGRLLHEASQDHTVVIDGRRIVDPSAFGDRPFRAVGRGQDAAPTAPVAGSPR